MDLIYCSSIVLWSLILSNHQNLRTWRKAAKEIRTRSYMKMFVGTMVMKGIPPAHESEITQLK